MSGRFLIVAPIAVIVTAALFFLMRELISAKAEYPEVVEVPDVKLARDIKDPPPPDDHLPRPDDVVPPDIDPPRPDYEGLKPKDGPVIGRPEGLIVSPNPDDFRRYAEGGARQIIRPTEYPSCGKGAGEAVLEYVVEPDGSVGHVRVIRATSSCFARAAERDAKRWRYRPEVVDGKAVRSGRKTVTVQYQQES